MSSGKDHSAIWRERLASRRAVPPGTGAVVGGASGARAHLSRGLAPRAGPSGADANPASSDSPDDTLSGADLHPVPNDGNGREMCWRCRRVAKLCVCGLVREVIGTDPIPNRLAFTVLQDRKEALKRPFGSAIVAELVLADCTSVWYDTKIPERVPRPPHLPDRGVGVLFPGPDARTLRRSPRTPIPGDRDRDEDGDESGDGDAPLTHLIVIDTTWHRARRMYGRIPWIRELPAYVLGEHTPLVRPGDASFDERGMRRERNGKRNGDGSDVGDDISDEPGDDPRDELGNEPEEGPRRESGYRIRKQPKPGFLSTAECIAAALREAEPSREDEADEAAPGERAAAAVEACFDAMIDAQVRSFSGRKNVRYRSRKAERAAKASAAGGRAGIQQTVAVR